MQPTGQATLLPGWAFGSFEDVHKSSQSHEYTRIKKIKMPKILYETPKYPQKDRCKTEPKG